jgi:GTP cyclohydrolase I
MNHNVTKDDALNAIITLLKWIGEDPTREGLLETPSRILESYKELFAGYNMNEKDILGVTFEDSGNYNQVIYLKNIKFKSMCEHHMLPIDGFVDIAYKPNGKVLGISKLARIVECFALRMQIQEKMTVQIAESIQKYLSPMGVAVKVLAHHGCMSYRGVKKEGTLMETYHFTGCFSFDDNPLK